MRIYLLIEIAELSLFVQRPHSVQKVPSLMLVIRLLVHQVEPAIQVLAICDWRMHPFTLSSSLVVIPPYWMRVAAMCIAWVFTTSCCFFRASLWDGCRFSWESHPWMAFPCRCWNTQDHGSIPWTYRRCCCASRWYAVGNSVSLIVKKWIVEQMLVVSFLTLELWC